MRRLKTEFLIQFDGVSLNNIEKLSLKNQSKFLGANEQ